MSLAVHDALVILTGLLVGLLSGVMGIGGGILLVPVMVLGFGFGQQVAQGTSLAAIVPTSVVGAYVHDRAGNVDRAAAAWVAPSTRRASCSPASSGRSSSSAPTGSGPVAVRK